MTDSERTYILIGAGGTGSIIFLPLLRYLEGFHGKDFTLAVIDGDAVAPSNLSRQLFFGRHVGDNKAEALLDAYQVTEKSVLPVPQYLGEKNIDELITDGDTILIAADNYVVRSFIEKRTLELNNATVINGGNEETDGSCQLFIRREGKNVTPPLSHCHPEINEKGPDRAAMTCQQIAELPGGGQTIVANMMSATMILNTLRLLHDWEKNPKSDPHHELHFDLETVKMRPADNRGIAGWNTSPLASSPS